MRVLRLTLGDIRVQWKSGFYAVYAIFTVVYIMALAAIPESARRIVAAVMIFSDPAAMGLFFMGALVLLEKSQRVSEALLSSPVRLWEYCAAKLLSLAVIGLFVAFVLVVFGGIKDIFVSLSAVFLASLLFSACGLMAAERSQTLNQFVLLAVPFELFICLPPAALLFGFDAPLLTLHPGVAAVRLIYGDASFPLLCFLSIVVWCAVAVFFCLRTLRRRFIGFGGEKA